jgi:hypothetical protein
MITQNFSIRKLICVTWLFIYLNNMRVLYLKPTQVKIFIMQWMLCKILLMQEGGL